MSVEDTSERKSKRKWANIQDGVYPMPLVMPSVKRFCLVTLKPAL